MALVDRRSIQVPSKYWLYYCRSLI